VRSSPAEAPATRRTRPRSCDNIVIDHLAELLAVGVKAKAWSIDDPGFTAVFMFSGLHGVVDDAYIKEKRVDRRRLTRRPERLCSGPSGWQRPCARDLSG